MTLECGQYVQHPKFGVAEIIGLDDENVTLLFEDGQRRKFKRAITNLEAVPQPQHLPGKRFGRFRVLPNMDRLMLEKLCNEFHADMKDNRTTFDDGGMALVVLQDIKRKGDLTDTTRKRLFRWCTTDGPVFQHGVDLARKICTVIYGRTPTREEADRP